MVIESDEDLYRRYFEGKDVSKLIIGEDVTTYAECAYYRRRAHDMCPIDRGYRLFNSMTYFEEGLYL